MTTLIRPTKEGTTITCIHQFTNNNRIDALWQFNKLNQRAFPFLLGFKLELWMHAARADRENKNAGPSPNTFHRPEIGNFRTKPPSHRNQIR